MGKRNWEVTVDGERHKVEVRWSGWTNSGELYLDNRIVDAWGITFSDKPLKFHVANKEALFMHPSLISGRCDLFVDGVKIKRN